MADDAEDDPIAARRVGEAGDGSSSAPDFPLHKSEVANTCYATAEFERELIRERVRSGMAVARARGTRIGRPRCHFDAARVTELRNQGRSWAEIAHEVGIGLGTAHRAFQQASRDPSG